MEGLHLKFEDPPQPSSFSFLHILFAREEFSLVARIDALAILFPFYARSILIKIYI